MLDLGLLFSKPPRLGHLSGKGEEKLSTGTAAAADRHGYWACCCTLRAPPVAVRVTLDEICSAVSTLEEEREGEREREQGEGEDVAAKVKSA